jgi:hypothetical protein
MAERLGEASGPALSKHRSMTAFTALRPAVRAAFGELIDYAGLFPPAQLTLAQARDEYRASRAGSHAWMLGRFIIPAQLLVESAHTVEGPFSVIVERQAKLDGLASARKAGVNVEALETPLREAPSADDVPGAIERLRSALAHAALDDLPTYVEIPRFARWNEWLPRAMNALRNAGLHAKIRCGGLTADAFPSVQDVAAFIAAARAAKVSFKATAGLHHPVRHRDRSTGSYMHGFLNLIAAAAMAPDSSAQTLERIVEEEDPAAFRFEDDAFLWRDRRASVQDLAIARRDAFVAYGSCSFAEPVADLKALGILNGQ